MTASDEGAVEEHGAGAPWPPVLARLSGFWRANLAAWVLISALGVATRTVFFGSVLDAAIVTLVLDAIGFGLTGIAHEVLSRQLRRVPGLGLANIRRRLELHYPGRHHFASGQEGPQLVARMSLKGPLCYV